MTGNLEGEDQRFTPTDWDWVMFLSGEINAIETRFDTFWTAGIATLCAFIGFLIACLVFQITYLISSDSILDGTSSIVVIFVNAAIFVVGAAIFVSFCYIFLNYKKKEREAKKMVERLEKCREGIFNGLDDPNKILECYLNAVGKKGDKNK